MTPREIREQQRLFKTLGMNVIAFLAQMDVLMLQESTVERGRKIARLCSDLELANDASMRYGLGLERKGTKLRRITGRVKGALK
jgi:hypothetical protein